MHTIQIKNIVLGEGLPKICVPLTAVTKEELKRQARSVASCAQADLVEWRADWYEDLSDESLENAILLLKKELGDFPLLFTIRTQKEGGEAEFSDEVYAQTCSKAMQLGVDAIDLELSCDKALFCELADEAKKNHIVSIASSHDFERTPAQEELISRAETMIKQGADICKFAVMPQNTADVLKMLEFSCFLKDNYPDLLFITMSMSKLGVLSRVCGSTFGSVLTFGTVGRASAPGQLDAESLKQILTALG